jgi:HEPN domain-containing protein
MSKSEYMNEARRWFATAEKDALAAGVLMKANLYAHACFQCQQAAEKAVKAVWYHYGLDPWGHSVQKLLSELPVEKAAIIPQQLQQKAAALDRFYIPTRYPNGLPDLIPSDSYFRADAELAVSEAAEIITNCRRILDS